MTRWGTSHFVNMDLAIKYYWPYAHTYADVVRLVERKLAEGEIHLGLPEVKAGQRVVVIDEGTRYGIEETNEEGE